MQEREKCLPPLTGSDRCDERSMVSKSILLFLCSATASAVSTAVFRSVLKDRILWKGSVSGLLLDTLAILKQPLFLFGIADFILASLLWLLVLASQPLSIAYPLQIGLVILLNTLISVFVFTEKINSYGIVGILLVMAGIVLISYQPAS